MMVVGIQPGRKLLWTSSKYSFGNFPGVRSIKADVSELCVGSIVEGIPPEHWRSFGDSVQRGGGKISVLK